MDLRSRFPVLEEVAYLNSGTCGPLPAEAIDAQREAVERWGREGRAKAYYERFLELLPELRSAWARAVGGRPAEVALTTSTSEGLARVLAGMQLGQGDVVLTADDEHPGLLGPLGNLRGRGVTVVEVPLERLPEAVEPGRTSVVACSHVSWVTGAVAPVEELAASGVPVVLDGAQGAGAIDVQVASLGCAAYAAAGQKWLCGPVGTGLLWVDPAFRERLDLGALAYGNLEEPARGLDAVPWGDARALDAPALSVEALEGALASARVLEDAGWDRVWTSAASRAATLATALRDLGCEVAPRDATSLVSWAEEDPQAVVDRCAAAGVVVRSLPGTRWVRASVGAWNDESDLERLLDARA